MSEGKSFDVFNAPDKGINLVESSAGTGKTYNISGLVVRFLAENPKLNPQNILVVTFTKAATQELRDRIGTRIREAVDVLDGSRNPEGDVFLEEVVRSYGGRKECLERLRKALLDMDQSSIFTIHGFCQQALQEYVFESNSSFDVEYSGDDSELMQEAADDVWRAEMNRLGEDSGANEHLLNLMVQEIKTPDAFLKQVKGLAGKPYLKYALQMSNDQFERLLINREQAIEDMKAHYQPEAITLLLDSDIMHKGSYNPKQVRAMLEEFQQIHVTGNAVKEEKFLKLAQDQLKVKKGCFPPEHPFCAAVQNYAEIDASVLKEAFYIRLTELFKKRLNTLKEERRTRSFDEILIAMDVAVRGNQQMRMKLREQFPVALVDEFQDTDPVQLSIFKELYFEQTNFCLYMIGDPKQSIYKFRGADIRSYQSVAENTGVRTFTLGKNYRSTKDMVDAVNAFFSHNQDGHHWPGGLQFTPSEAHKTEKELTIESGEPEHQPLHFLMPEEEALPIKGAAEKQVAIQSANEIARLLNLAAHGKAKLFEAGVNCPLRPGHIAVLVRGHHEAEMMKKQLLIRNIKSVHKSNKSVFQSEEASFLANLLRMIKENARPTQLRMFLFGRLMGYRMSDLQELGEDSYLNSLLLEAFIDLRLVFERQGFSAMLRKFLNSSLAKSDGKPVRVLENILSYVDGERVYTNLMHINELADEMDREHRPGLEELLKWLTGKIEAAQDTEDSEIRLDSDDDLVQIVTMHSSKGLEYPVVFCNSLWCLGLKTSNPLIYYDTDEYQTMVDITGYDKENTKGIVDAEELAENIRLMYVALTRARNRCYISVGPHEAIPSRTSALHFAFMGAKSTLVCKKMESFESYLNIIRSFVAANAKLAVCRSFIPEQRLPLEPSAAAVATRALTLSRQLSARPDWFVTSYSSIKKGATPESALLDDAPETDKAPEENPLDHDQLAESRAMFTSIFDFPKGAQAGTFMHRLFEDLDFPRLETDAEPMVNKYLAEDGYDTRWTDVITDMLRNSISKKLTGSGARLVDKSSAHTIDEMEFFFALEHAGADAIMNIMRGKVSDKDLLSRGFMTGFIDLLFEHKGRYYILDYKSDMIGSTFEDYQTERLSETMHERGYVFQYHIYLVALMRFLKQKMGNAFDYDTHIGGAYYLFLRGIHEGSEHDGIYFDNPDRTIIENLDHYFKGEGQYAAKLI